MLPQDRPCADCGAPLIPNKTARGLCMRCYQRRRTAGTLVARPAPAPCLECGAPRSRNRAGLGLCRPCYMRRWRQSPPAPAARPPCRACGALLVANRVSRGLCRHCYGVTYNRAYYRAHRERRRDASRAWRAANPGRVVKRTAVFVQSGRARAYRAANRERVNATSRAYAARYPEKVYAASRAWVARNREKVREYQGRRNARRRGQVVSPVSFEDIWQRDGGRCGICGGAVERDKVVLDHILPLACGGTHEPSNVRIAHHACNNRRLHLGSAQLRLLG